MRSSFDTRVSLSAASRPTIAYGSMGTVIGISRTAEAVDGPRVEQATFPFHEDLGLAPACSRAIAAWVNNDPRARMLLSRSGRVHWANDAAGRLLTPGSGGLCSVGGFLVADTEGIAVILSRLLREARIDASLHAVTPSADAGRQWLLWARQLTSGGDPVIGFAAHRMADPVSYDAMLETHHLTPCETRIVALMLAGLETGRIAQRQDISIETLRTHIKHAYSKLGVRSRGELFAKAVHFADL